MKNILITGGTGLVGASITRRLKEKGYSVAYLSRTAGMKNGIQKFRWDIKASTVDKEALDWADAIIHLAGAGVADKRWSPSRKKEILDSRVTSSKVLFDALENGAFDIKQIVSASAIGYYGFAGADTLFTEDAQPANDFLATVTEKWEKATSQFGELNIPNAQVRIGVVLSSKGGAMEKIATPIRFGLGAPIGSGEQITSWIHIEDLADIFIYLLESKKTGIFNGVAPHAATNKMLTKLAAKVLKKPLFLPNVPAFVLKLALGEMADIVLKGANISSRKIESIGFTFKHPELEPALRDIFERKV